MGLDFVGIGSLGIDIIKTPEGTFTESGGSAANTTAALQKLGLKTGIIGRVGADKYGTKILKDLKELGVDTSEVVVDHKCPTTISYITVKNMQAKIEKMDCLKRLNRFTEDQKNYLDNVKSILIGPRLPIFDKYAFFAKSKNIITYVTLHMAVLDNESISVIKKIKPMAIFANQKESRRIKNLLDREIPVIVTNGGRGSTIYTGKGQKIYPAFKVKPIDPLGTGDAFAAGFIYGDLKGWDTDKKMALATAAGALATQQIGARKKLYGLEEMEKFIKVKQRASRYGAA